MDLLAACTLKPAITAKPKTVSVNGVEISRARISQETQNHPAAKPVDAWLQAARALVIRELLLQESRALGLTPEPKSDQEGRRETEDEALVRSLIEHEVKTPEPDGDVCRRYYQQNLRRFRSADLFGVSHILLAAEPGDQVTRAEARREADVLIQQLTAEPEQFAKLAKLHSACPSRDVGGNLGQIGPGQTVPEFESALAAMTAGRLHPAPVESRYGFHVVHVHRREDGRQLPFEIVHERIAGYLTERVHRTAIRQYISRLAGKAIITGIELSGTNSPLIQ
jgi:peptidyl-prolyl cis-trans isomerase C